MLNFSRKLTASVAIASAMLISVMPSTANAGSLHIDLPHLSLGFNNHNGHSRHHGERRDHYRPRHTNRRPHRQARRNNHRDNYYSRYNRHNDWGRNSHRNSYRNGYRDSYRNQYSSRSYRNPICPDAGYSPYYNDNRNCYRHKDHFHCR